MFHFPHSIFRTVFFCHLFLVLYPFILFRLKRYCAHNVIGKMKRWVNCSDVMCANGIFQMFLLLHFISHVSQEKCIAFVRVTQSLIHSLIRITKELKSDFVMEKHSKWHFTMLIRWIMRKKTYPKTKVHWKLMYSILVQTHCIFRGSQVYTHFCEMLDAIQMADNVGIKKNSVTYGLLNVQHSAHHCDVELKSKMHATQNTSLTLSPSRSRTLAVRSHLIC